MIYIIMSIKIFRCYYCWWWHVNFVINFFYAHLCFFVVTGTSPFSPCFPLGGLVEWPTRVAPTQWVFSSQPYSWSFPLPFLSIQSAVLRHSFRRLCACQLFPQAASIMDPPHDMGDRKFAFVAAVRAGAPVSFNFRQWQTPGPIPGVISCRDGNLYALECQVQT